MRAQQTWATLNVYIIRLNDLQDFLNRKMRCLRNQFHRINLNSAPWSTILCAIRKITYVIRNWKVYFDTFSTYLKILLLFLILVSYYSKTIYKSKKSWFSKNYKIPNLVEMCLLMLKDTLNIINYHLYS